MSLSLQELSFQIYIKSIVNQTKWDNIRDDNEYKLYLTFNELNRFHSLNKFKGNTSRYNIEFHKSYRQLYFRIKILRDKWALFAPILYTLRISIIPEVNSILQIFNKTIVEMMKERSCVVGL